MEDRNRTDENQSRKPPENAKKNLVPEEVSLLDKCKIKSEHEREREEGEISSEKEEGEIISDSE